MNNDFIAYTRVSSARQGTNGVSLTEQRRTIAEYAKRHNLSITEWFEEQQSAAKRGRPVFDQMMKKLTSGGFGLLLHKVDRGARNLRDWASIGEAIDLGVDVRFAHDDFDLTTRGGRLAADIQAVIAADYIRNLKEEVRKGVEGRLRQGLYPLRAPRGYRDCGGGRVKQPDPIIAPLIIAVFERYATGNYTYRALATEMAIQGLTKRDGLPLSPDAMSHILNNPFYAGEMRVKGKSYEGMHQPLISLELYKCVQKVRRRRSSPKRHRHVFQYQRRLQCLACNGFLTGEQQKGHVYYRCHRCTKSTVREDRVLQPLKDRSYCIIASAPKQLEPFAKFESANVSELTRTKSARAPKILLCSLLR